MYRGFIQTVPRELEEAAQIDGCNIWRVFWNISFPLLKPITTTIVIFNVMWIWNDFMLTYLFLNSSDKATLVMQVYNGIGMFSNDWSLMMPALVIALFPMVVFYLVMQKRIVEGVEMCIRDRAYSVTLSGLARTGTILLPVWKSEGQEIQNRMDAANRGRLIAAAKNGDEEAMESLTIEDMDTYAMISKRIENEDIYSIVDTYFMPYGME